MAAWTSLTETQRKLGQLILDAPDEIVFTTTRSLAQRAGASPATVVRFAQQLGLDGFPALRAVVHRELLAGVSPSHRLEATLEELRDLPEDADVLAHTLARDRRNLDATLELIGVGTFRRAVDLLTAARITYLAGLGLSRAPADALAFRLRRTGLPTVTATAAGTDLYDAVLPITTADLLVVIGSQPVPGELVRVATWAADRGIGVLAITDTRGSTLGAAAEVALHARRGPLGHLTSVVSPLAVTNALAVAVAQSRSRQAAAAYAALEQLSDLSDPDDQEAQS